MIRILSDPSPTQLAGRANGIAQVIHYLAQLLPQHGFEYVKDPNAADIFVRHAGAHNTPSVHVTHCHGLMPTAMRPSDAWEWRVNRDVIDNLMCAARITVPSQWVGEAIRRDMRVSPDVVAWGIDPTEWSPGTNQGYVLWGKGRSHGVNDPTPVMQLAASAVDIPFVTTFGTVGANVRVTGIIPFEQMRQLIRNADVYMATTRETFGIQTLEAMACGVPVLGFRWAATPDIVTHKETGYLAEPGNIKDLMEGLHYCRKYRSRLGAAAREVASKFTWDAAATEIARIYKEVLEPHKGPEVSIVIPCYNYGQWLGEAIQSALDQNGPTHEVIVVDDASTDNTLEVAERFGGRITIVHQPYNQGVAAARNRGASIAQGRYVAFLDADDMMEQGWLASTYKALESDPRAGIAYTRLQILVPDGSLRPANWPPPMGDVQALLQCRNSVPTCCLIRKEAFVRAGGYSGRFTPTEDGELWTKIAECGYNVLCANNKPLFTYRMGHASLSRGKQLPDYKPWHLPTLTGQAPFAALSPISGSSHGVRDYDRPIIGVVILHGGDKRPEELIDTLDILHGQTYRFWTAKVYGSGPIPDLRAYPYVRGSIGDPLDSLQTPLVFVVDSGDNIFDARTLERALAEWQKTGTAGDLIPKTWIEASGGISIDDTRDKVFLRLRDADLL